jgi:homoserine kinase
MKVYPSPSPMFSVRVKVPATTANLGAGYDVLGLALGYYNEVEISAWNDPLMPPVAIQVDGEGADELPLDRGNLIYKAVRAAIDRIGRSVPAVRIKAVNRIPLARGLGSSSAAIVAGLLGVNAGFGGKLSLDELIDLAVKLEGHPDNVVPALAGGLCVAAQDGAKTHYLSWTGKSLFRGMRAVVAVPYFKLSTHEAR